MKWAILIYAYLAYPQSDNIEKVISWNLPFASYQECKSFYHMYEDNLQTGVLVHAKEQYKADMIIREMGCARAVIHQPGEDPDVSGLRPIFKRGPEV